MLKIGSLVKFKNEYLEMWESRRRGGTLAMNPVWSSVGIVLEIGNQPRGTFAIEAYFPELRNTVRCVANTLEILC